MVHADLFLHKLVPKIEVLEVSAVVLVSSKKSTVGVVIGTKFWLIQVQCCKTKKKKKRRRNWHYQYAFFLFYMRNVFKSNKQWLYKYLSGNLRLI